MNIFMDAVPGHDKYTIEDEVGHGAYSEVYRAVDKETGKVVALKYMHLDANGQLPLHVQREVDALQAINHSNVVSFYHICQQQYSVSLVLEYCNVDLMSVLRRSRPNALSPALIKTIMFQLLSALNACHSAGLMHRDIAPSNVLISQQGIVKLGDFGQARHPLSTSSENVEKCGSLSPIVGTRWYKAPELLFGSRSYNNAIDIWAAGCIFAELLNGAPLFPGNSDIDQICKVFDKLGSLTEDIWPGVKHLKDWGKLAFPDKPGVSFQELLPTAPASAVDVIQGMLKYVPESRISPEQALTAAYFTEEPEMLEPNEVAVQIRDLLSTPKRDS